MKYLAKKSFLVVFVLTLSFIFIFVYVLDIENRMISAGIAASFAVILSPRKKKIKTQTGEKTQITWIFLKEPIFLD
jgi:exosome complex RNA-binding protein Rrp42 (RNase PH superfamily)